MKSTEKKTTGAEEIHWNLGDLYAGIDDPAFANDQVEVLERAQSFATQYRGRNCGIGCHRIPSFTQRI